MVKSPTKNSAPTAVVERIHERLSKGEGPGDEVIRQESVRAELPISMLEAILRLDKRFVRTQAGWQVQAPGDRWTDLACALLHSTAEGTEAHDLFWQVVVELNATTRLEFTEYYPGVFTFPDSLRKQVTELIRSCPPERISELKGPIFDLVMSYLFDDAEHNRFFTPRAITWLAAAWACPQPGERIVDPCYGSGGFPLAMAQAMRLNLTSERTAAENLSMLLKHASVFSPTPGHDQDTIEPTLTNSLLYGLDRDQVSFWSGRTNLELHGFSNLNLVEANSLDLSRLPVDLESCDVVVGNPPFGEKITAAAILEQFDLGRDGKGQLLGQQMSELLFIEAFLRLGKPGARIVILLPDGILANVGEQRTRDYLRQHAIIKAIIALPRRVFRNDAKANVLFLRKKRDPDQTQDSPVFLAAIEDIETGLEEALYRYSAGFETQ